LGKKAGPVPLANVAADLNPLFYRPASAGLMDEKSLGNQLQVRGFKINSAVLNTEFFPGMNTFVTQGVMNTPPPLGRKQ
jgi:hypothetical protein